MSAGPIQDTSRGTLTVRLDPFEPAHARTVSSWVRTAHDAYLLAPRTPPPITPERVLEWSGPGNAQFLLYESGAGGPVAYGEINELNGSHTEFWLGHLIVDPDRRGEGLGKALTRLLLQRAFRQFGARRASLVVFSDNLCAVACYRAAGLYPDGFEKHDFPPYGTSVRLLRMATTGLDE